MRPPLYDFGGAGRPLHLAVANGFPPQTYIPLLKRFTADYRVCCLSPRPLWGDAPPPEQRGTWHEVADDILAGWNAYDLRDMVAIGHSFGGVASILAALQTPERLRGLVLLDPTIVMGQVYDLMRFAQENDQTEMIPLVQGARRRRRTFESAEAAYAYFSEKPLFSDWPDETIRLYAESISRPTADGVELAWSPEWEVYYYASMYLDSWDDLPNLRGLLPVLIIRGGKSDTFLQSAAEKVLEILPDAAYAEIEGHGHLFPQTAPEQTSGIIGDWLARQP